jgi:hypothetical protein
MGEEMDFDGLLKFCVELSGKLDLDGLLRDAELLCNYAGQAGCECVAGLPVLPHMRDGAALVPAALAALPPTPVAGGRGGEAKAEEEAAAAAGGDDAGEVAAS